MNEILFVSTHKHGDGVNLMLWGKGFVFATKEDIWGNVGITPLILNLGTRWAEKNKADIFNASEPRKEF